MTSSSAVLPLLLLLLLGLSSALGARFDESLLVRSLPDGKVLLSLDFRLSRDGAAPAGHYTLFPQPLGDVVRAHDLTALHVTYAQGRFRSADWPSDVVAAAPPGVEVWAEFGRGNASASASPPADGGVLSQTARLLREDSSSRSPWSYLMQTLGGVYCGALAGMAAADVRPGGGLGAAVSHGDVHYARAPRETLCTENMTPASKMLPCGRAAGIGRLLAPHGVLASAYHAMHVDVARDEETGEVVLEQAVRIVLAPDDPRLVHIADELDACPLASSSSVVVQLSAGHTSVATGARKPDAVDGMQTFTYDLAAGGPLPSLALAADEDRTGTFGSALGHGTDVTVRRVALGLSMTTGVFKITLENHADEPRDISYLDVLPWYFRLYTHTLRAAVNGKQADVDAIVYSRRVLVADDRDARPSVVEFELALAAHARVELSIDFDKAFLGWLEHPPDAHHGFDAGAAIVTYDAGRTRVYSEPVIIQHALPDFSMPFNVIMLSCTVTSLLFGSLVAILVKEWPRPGDPPPPPPPLVAIMRAISRLIKPKAA